MGAGKAHERTQVQFDFLISYFLDWVLTVSPSTLLENLPCLVLATEQ